jgi:hypothetical protein
MIEEMEVQILTSERREDQFDNPNWSYKQAYKNGRLSTIKSLKELLSFIN